MQIGDGRLLGDSAVGVSNDDEDTGEETMIIEVPRDNVKNEEVELPIGEPGRPKNDRDRLRRPPFESP